MANDFLRAFSKIVAIVVLLFAHFGSLHAQEATQSDAGEKTYDQELGQRIPSFIEHLQINKKIDWQQEEQACARYLAARQYAEQILSYENWPVDKQAKWITQLTWHAFKGLRMSSFRYALYFKVLLSTLDENRTSDVERVQAEVNVFGRITARLKELLDGEKMMELWKSFTAKFEANNQRAKEIWLLNKANCLLMMTPEYKPSLVTDDMLDNISRLHEAHRALFYSFIYHRELSAIHYQKAIQEGMPELKNRAEVAREDYDVTQDMHRAIALLKEANALLESASEQSKEKLDDIFEELLRVHERISYTTTFHLSPSFCRAWFAEYSEELNKLRLHSKKADTGSASPRILDEDNLKFLYFIAI